MYRRDPFFAAYSDLASYAGLSSCESFKTKAKTTTKTV